MSWLATSLARCPARERSDAARRRRRRRDPALHLGHHRPSQGRAAHQRELPRGVRLFGASPLGTYEPDDVVLIAMPFFHVAGVNIGLLTLAQGAHGIVLGDIDPAGNPATDRKEKITYAFLVPAVILFLLQHPNAKEIDFSSAQEYQLRRLADLRRTAADAQRTFGCEFLQLYGLTETTGGGTFLAPDGSRSRARQAALLRQAGAGTRNPHRRRKRPRAARPAKSARS
jgi:acyl-CoA synthetase (AMP-forming)/AMP-acid ligase II